MNIFDEFRTPLNAIIGCIRLIRDGCSDSREEELEFLQQADEAAIYLLNRVCTLRDIAEIEAGKVELNLQPVSIQDLCHLCLRMMQPVAEKRHLSLSQNVSPDLNFVPLDERCVRQMITNLLSNAINFTPSGGEIMLGANLALGHRIEQDIYPDRGLINPNTNYLCLEVHNTGIGIPKERSDLILQTLQQRGFSTHQLAGIKLELALTKRLAELHGGTVSFTSNVGKGTTFRIWLPL